MQLHDKLWGVNANMYQMLLNEEADTTWNLQTNQTSLIIEVNKILNKNVLHKHVHMSVHS